MLQTLANLSADELDYSIRVRISYAEARQLCHEAGIKQIKGNCRRVLIRRLNRLNTVDKTGRLNNILRGTNNGKQS